jgi:hypothetical protein
MRYHFFFDRHVKTSPARRSGLWGLRFNMRLILFEYVNSLMKLLLRVLRRWQLHKTRHNKWLSTPVPGGSHQIAVHLPDEFQRYPFGTYGFTFSMVRTASK